MLHCLRQSIRRINENNFRFYLFDSVPDYDRYIDEYNAYKQLLINHGIEVYELSDLIVNNRELMSYLPNLACKPVECAKSAKQKTTRYTGARRKLYKKITFPL